MPNATPRPYILAETTWKAVKDTDYEVAVLPWGATEAHNYHLPYATDTIQCDYVAAESARRAWEQEAKVIVLPTVPFGVNTGQIDIKLDINMNPSTQAAVLRDVVDALSIQGIPKLLVLNGHGGNSFNQMIREIQIDYRDVFLCTTNWYQNKVVTRSNYFEKEADHAGEMETSVMMHVAPELVRPLSEAGDGKEHEFRIAGLREGWIWAQREWIEVTDDTGVGDPSLASPEKGERYLRAVTRKIGQFLVDLAAADPKDMYED
jgi:creatinine amidohydrolase